MPDQTKRFRIVGLSTIFLLSIVAIFFWQFQKVSDWYKLLGYNPPAAVAQLANQDTMNNYTKHLFYLNKPQLISNVATFRKSCPEDQQTIVLGCYHPDQAGIYIFSVNDSRLYGLEQVTAAHEVLHAVYARLSNQDRKTLDNELMVFYKHGLHNKRVQAEVKIYQKTEPKDVYDEMSCTFGTEIANLPKALDDYYAKYFTNRLTIVAYEDRYDTAFSSLQNKVNSYDNELKSLQTEINSNEIKLEAQLDDINSQRSNLNSLNSSGQISEFNQDVPGFDAGVNSYNTGVDNLQAEISGYNSLVKTRNSVAVELGNLDNEIDTRLTPQSTH